MRGIVVVTGASSGIGFATAKLFAREGWDVFAGMRNPQGKAERLKAETDGLPVTVLQMDVTREESVQAAFETVAEHGPVDVLVNNAGIGGAAPFEDTPADENRLLFETNYFGAVRCIQSVLPEMRRQERGSIVNVTSTSGLFPWPNQACYAASKWALQGLTASLAHEVWRFGIRVSSVAPGAIETEIFENSKERTRYDRDSPYRGIMRRNGRLIMAGLRGGTTAEFVARTVLEAATGEVYHLIWPAGLDAEAIAANRNQLSLDEWVALGGDVTDEVYDDWFQRNLGIGL